MLQCSHYDIAELFDIDTSCSYKDGDLVGICSDGLVRPLNINIKPIEYIGIVSLKPQIILGNVDLTKDNKIPIAIAGKKTCWVKGKVTPGRKVTVDYGNYMFKLHDKVFDHEYNGIIITVKSETEDKCLCDILLK